MIFRSLRPWHVWARADGIETNNTISSCQRWIVGHHEGSTPCPRGSARESSSPSQSSGMHGCWSSWCFLDNLSTSLMFLSSPLPSSPKAIRCPPCSRPTSQFCLPTTEWWSRGLHHGQVCTYLAPTYVGMQASILSLVETLCIFYSSISHLIGAFPPRWTPRVQGCIGRHASSVQTFLAW